MVQHGLSEAIKNMYKTNMIQYDIAYFQNEVHAGSGHPVDPKETNVHEMAGKLMFCAIALGALWCPLGLDHFLARTTLRSDEAPRNVRNSLF